MSVVSELRTLADEMDARGEKYAQNPQVMSVFREAAQVARLRALRAETNVECRTDERPRFARLKAPQRPRRHYEAVPYFVPGSFKPVDIVVLEARERPLPAPPRHIDVARRCTPLPPDCEHYSCDGCGRAGVWHRGLISPPDGKQPRRLCRSCKAKEPPEDEKGCRHCTKELPCLNHL